MQAVKLKSVKDTEKEPTRRLFFALWPNDAERAALAAWQSPLHVLCGGREMRPETLHATLVFMGNVGESRLEALCLAAREVNFQAFELNLTEARYWGHNHIVHAAPETIPSALAELVQGLERSLARHRFRLERRPYKPHVSLLRNAKWSDELLPPMPAVRWQIEQFVLVQSLSDANGPLYRMLAHFGV
jgi:2'-5' RNA ligase